MIPEDILMAYGAKDVGFTKNERIFDAGSDAIHYYQVASGAVKMANFSSEGQEFIQGVFHGGHSFGEPALFGEFPYPAAAYAMEDSTVWRQPKRLFFKLLEEHFDIHKKFNYELSHRLRYKGMMLSEMSSYPPEHRMMTLFNYLRSKHAKEASFTVPYTRQQIANMTGLRVETVIRTIKKMEASQKVKMKKHKIILDKL